MGLHSAFSIPKLAFFVALLVVFFGAAAWIHWLATRSSDVSFLPRHAPAEWIIYPKPPIPHRQAVAELPAVFRRAFELSQPPPSATLRMCACRQASAVINGKALHSPVVADWKVSQQFEVGSYLVKGENLISVTVSNLVGPPALWLSLSGAGLALQSDASWEASYAGAVWQPAQLASQPSPAGTGNPLSGGEKTLTSMRNCAPILGALLLAAMGLVAAGRWWFKRTRYTHSSGEKPGSAGIPSGESPQLPTAGAGISHPSAESHVDALPLEPPVSPAKEGLRASVSQDETSVKCPPTLLSRWPWLADPAAVTFLLAAILWIALIAHNLSFIPRSAGFDTDGHLEYIQYIQQHKALPLADEGWEMHQPPLYYVLGAAALDVFGLSVGSFDGLAVLRLLSLAISLMHLAFIFASMRLLFPGQSGPQTVGLALAAFLPMQLYLAHYVTNETLSACLMCATFYFILKIQRADPSPWVYLTVGLFLGLALLTKLTALILIPFVGAALIYRCLESRVSGVNDQVAADAQSLKTRHSTSDPHLLRRWLLSLLSVLVCLAVCGWHYWRVWRHFGRVLFPDTRWAYGASWWQDPGYTTSATFTRFGRALIDPFFSGLASFTDGMYSTLWGDGLCGGMSALRFRPPWNYSLMAVGYVAALLPTALILAGLLATTARSLRPRNSGSAVMPAGESLGSSPPDWAARMLGLPGCWLAVLALGFWLALALVHQNLVVPTYAEAKAVFALSGLVALCVLAGAGWEWLARKAKPFAPITAVLFAFWALTSYASFWVQGDSPTTQTVVGRGLMRSGNYAGALAELESALRRDPSNLAARSFLVATLLAQNRVAEAADLAARTASGNPNDAFSQMDLATVLETGGQMEDALQHAARAVELAPDDPDARLQLALRLFKLGRHTEAIAACRQALRLSPTDPELHLVLAVSLQSQNDDALTGDALDHFRMAIKLAPDSPDALNRLAWVLATHPNPQLRNGQEAVLYAERACALTGNRDPNILDTLAAAQAEAGQYGPAIATTEQVEKLLATSDNSSARQRNQRLNECFRAGRPFHQQSSAPNTNGKPP